MTFQRRARLGVGVGRAQTNELRWVALELREASDPFAPPMVTMGRGSFGDVGVDNEFVEPSEEVFGTINPDDL